MLGQTSTLMNSTSRRLTRCFITVEIVPSYLPRLWPPKQGLKAKSNLGGSRNPYLEENKAKKPSLYKVFVTETHQIRSEGAGGKLTLRVPLMLCNCNCKVIFVLVMFFLTHSLWANLATVSDLKMPSTNRALKPGKGGNSPGVLGVDPEPEVASSMDCSGRTSSSSFNKEDPDKVLDLFKSLWYQELLSTSAESSSSLSSTAAWRLKSKKKK